MQSSCGPASLCLRDRRFLLASTAHIEGRIQKGSYCEFSAQISCAGRMCQIRLQARW